jgi:hypothetical protein
MLRINTSSLAGASRLRIVFEATGPRDQPSLYTQSDRDRVASPRSALLLGTMVLIGRQSETNVTFTSARRLLQPVALDPTRGPSPIEEGYVTTFGLGHLVLQVLRVKRREGGTVEKITLHPTPGPWNRLLIQLCPRQRAVVQWPPASSFSETGTTLDQLSRRFGRGSG